MAIREIRKNGDPILHKTCKAVKVFDEKLHTLLDDMHETLASYDGVGLAGPQVGILKRVFICDYEGQRIEAVNPEIIGSEGEQTGKEGCLSVPDEWYDVTRPEKVTLKAMDRSGKEFVMDAEGLIARCICHETDHLDGILFTQRITEEEKQRQLDGSSEDEE
ncbi:MAG: peptide deformylase [Clostridia bacterium]|nr:peptide deformylase [Clostridia bacterium]